MLKKTLIAASVASVVSAGAVAGTWTPGTAPEFAEEIFGTGSGATVLTVPDAVYTMAATPGAGSAFNVTFTLTGATWGTALTSGSLSLDDADTSSSAASVTLVSDGGVADSSATFRIDVSNSITTGDNFNLAYDLDGFNGSSATLAVSLVDGLGAVDTAGVATTVATTEDGTVGTVAAGAALTIDVATNSTEFTSGTTAILGNITVTDNGAALAADGASGWDSTGNATTGNLAGADLVVSGDFTAAMGVDTDNSANTSDGVWLDLDNSGTYDAGEEATTLTTTEATWNLSAADATTMANGAAFNVYMMVDGVTSIVESDFTASLQLDRTTATYVDDSFSGAFTSANKNGDTVDLDLLLTPSGAFSNFVRITNKSAVEGDVFITLFNDEGDSVSIELGDIDGVDTSALSGNASTALLNINDIYAAAQAADATFMVADGANKLRARIEGEFGDIEAQNLSLATDNSYFGTF